MNFTVATRPLNNALSLGIVNANISKYYSKSGLAEITADKRNLTINLEASYLLSEIILKGSGDCDEPAKVFVDAALLKQLVSTFDSDVTEIEFVENGIVLHSGKSKFQLPQVVDGSQFSLNKPTKNVPATATTVPLQKEDWKFIKDNQMYAIALSFVNPVYTRVWVGAEGNVLVGDVVNGLFTHSKKSNLGETCLLSDTIINLFDSVPEGAKLTKLESSYILNVETDSFAFASEFTPQYEDTDNLGSYNAEIFLEMMKENNTCIEINTTQLSKFMSQAAILSTSVEDTITLSVSDKLLSLQDNNIDCKLDITYTGAPYSLRFQSTILKSAISNMDEDKIKISCLIQNDEPSGIILSTPNMITLVGAVD